MPRCLKEVESGGELGWLLGWLDGCSVRLGNAAKQRLKQMKMLKDESQNRSFFHLTLVSAMPSMSLAPYVQNFYNYLVLKNIRMYVVCINNGNSRVSSEHRRRRRRR